MSELVQFVIINIGTLSMNKFWGETERLRSPSATCTLLQAGGTRLLVDPSPEPATQEPIQTDRLQQPVPTSSVTSPPASTSRCQR